LCVVAASAVLPVPAGALARKAGPVRIGNAYLSRRVQYAFDGAAKRLQKPECQQIFGEFKDQEGRTLQDNLDTLGDSGASFIERLLFYEAGGHQRCKSGLTLALTTPGSRVVLICGEAFRKAAQNDPGLAEVVIIHEALHCLGLGENPPTSHEITKQVLKRCRR
jgi:hypothetical protein